MFQVMITAAASNSGKTAVTCGLLALLKRQGLDPCAFKCGPDYIDPMFHRSVLGIDSSNLDVFLAGEEGVKEVFARNRSGHDAVVCEGVMGYYDGITGNSARASAWHVASLLEIPAIMVIRPKGAALTLAAVIKGMCEFRAPSRICGVIFNDCSEMYYSTYAPAIEAECGIPVLGYLPHMEEAGFESRHLGLMTAEEIADLSARIDRIGERMEETVDLARLFEVCGSNQVNRLQAEGGQTGCAQTGCAQMDFAQKDALEAQIQVAAPDVRIAVARDKAFNFIYADSIRALREAGVEPVFFSPLDDSALPENVSGLYLPGGYPELYARQLAANESMRGSIRAAVEGGLPTIAECGGFLYLSSQLEDTEGSSWPMAGVLPGSAANKGRLVRFGYGFIGSGASGDECAIGASDNSCTGTAPGQSGECGMLFRPGEQIPVHEFHYWDTDCPGSDLTLTKNSNGKQWQFGYATETLYAGFPHLYLAGTVGTADGVSLAERFAEAARRYKKEREDC